jgi:hypothetical protein
MDSSGDKNVSNDYNNICEASCPHNTFMDQAIYSWTYAHYFQYIITSIQRGK